MSHADNLDSLARASRFARENLAAVTRHAVNAGSLSSRSTDDVVIVLEQLEALESSLADRRRRFTGHGSDPAVSRHSVTPGHAPACPCGECCYRRHPAYRAQHAGGVFETSRPGDYAGRHRLEVVR